MSAPQPLPILVERNLLIPVSFGATLAADLFRPAGEGKFPALISLYPYHKDDSSARSMTCQCGILSVRATHSCW